MIEELRIENLGVIAAAELRLGPGLTVITGETGAGKTMVLSGLHLLLGGAPDPDAVRPGAERIVVEGTLVPPAGSPALTRALDAGADLDDGALIMTRIVPAAGRSRAIVGGRTVPQRLLGEIGADLIAVHGQADQLRLRSAAHQRAALDAFAGTEHAEMLRDYRRTWTELAEARSELQRWRAEEGTREARRAFLREALEELESLDPQAGEDTSLRAEAERLDNVEELRLAADEAHRALSGTGEAEAPDAATLLDRARRALDSTTVDPLLSGYSERLAEVGYLVADLGTELATYLDGLDGDPRRLEAIHERRAALGRIAARLDVPADDLAAWSQEAGAELLELDDPSAGGEVLERRVSDLHARLMELAGRLTASRTAAAEGLAEAVSAELSALAMPAARIEAELTAEEEPGPWGAETVSITLRPHPDAPARPLGSGASGGELSRVMLALEVALANSAGTRPQGTFVFDEVDAGVGGKAALEVGRRLAALARSSQVIVVTHLAQVAAFADAHLVVAKDVRDSTALTDVSIVTGEERERELARMLSGHEDSDVARRHAAEMLQAATVGR